MGRPSYTVDVRFCKKKELIFISHLDVVRLFQRAFRRISLPLLYTQGYHSRPKMSFQRALRLGVKSNKEKMVVFFTEDVDLQHAKVALNQTLPKGIRIVKMVYRRKKGNRS